MNLVEEIRYDHMGFMRWLVPCACFLSYVVIAIFAHPDIVLLVLSGVLYGSISAFVIIYTTRKRHEILIEVAKRRLRG